VRAGFSGIRVHVKVEANMTKEEKEKFVKEIDACCPISDKILKTTQIEFEVE